MNSLHLNSFNQWIAWAQQDLSTLPPAAEAPVSRSLAIKHAKNTLTHALIAANRLGCPARKALCLRVLNWLNADARRAA
jgi:hypothetical protein